MASLTSAGLTIDTYAEILEQINSAQRSLIDANIDTSSDTLIGQYTSIIALRLSALQELIQAVYNAKALSKAEGKALDDLVEILGITRNAATPTTGTLRITGSSGQVVPAGFTVANVLTNDQYTTSTINSTSIDPLNCVSCTVDVVNLTLATAYTINIDGVDYTHATSIGDSVQTIVESWANQINLDANANVTATEDDTTLTLVADSNTMAVTRGSSDLVLTTVTIETNITSTVTGSISAAAGVITDIVTPTASTISVTNPDALATGAEVETDEELRTRVDAGFTASGKATNSAIRTALLSDPNISTASVEENTTSVAVNGIDAYSFRAVVEGSASDDEIAQIIFDTKAAGVGTSGTNTGLAVDDLGNPFVVSFSRASAIPIFVTVEYEVYSEEDLTTGIDVVIENALNTAFNSLSVGEDVIPKRFYNAIYSATTGLSSINVYMSTSASPTTETPIAIGSSEKATLQAGVTVVQV